MSENLKNLIWRNQEQYKDAKTAKILEGFNHEKYSCYKNETYVVYKAFKRVYFSDNHESIMNHITLK